MLSAVQPSASAFFRRLSSSAFAFSNSRRLCCSTEDPVGRPALLDAASALSGPGADEPPAIVLSSVPRSSEPCACVDEGDGLVSGPDSEDPASSRAAALYEAASACACVGASAAPFGKGWSRFVNLRPASTGQSEQTNQ